MSEHAAGTGPAGVSSVVARLRPLPKVALHDHLDGGLRPATVLELAREDGYEGLPADDEAALAAWFAESADSGSLVRYLETFAQTLAVMQTEAGLRRVAREAVVDLAADGVVHAELRYAPEQHTERGLTMDQVVLAVEEGLREGEEEAAGAGHPVTSAALLTAMRHAGPGAEAAELTLRHTRREGSKVAGFDIAGAEDGHPPTRQLAAFRALREGCVHYTIHAGEAFGLPSIRDAVLTCGAERVGHGVRLVEDLTLDGRPVAEVARELPFHRWDAERLSRVRLGRLAGWIRDRQLPLELCPSSNLQTGAAPSWDEHPVTLLHRLGFAVTVSCDNRLMSRTTMSAELAALVERHGWSDEDLARVAVRSARSAFLPLDVREQLVRERVLPGYRLEAVPGG
ncbi:adenosine deaminase [Ornithinicoccus halotolerans]|uniref:adenosine deaminase n=1 Tax=Ornithinicoccus halotolerans TaxID=1748220 RepID=UPI001E5C46DF|nr:adenosine deaminase [Ornithinicoccus halotolerans]